jgi:NIMA (never in mitosis gene a)-related kinase 1/4/5
MEYADGGDLQGRMDELKKGGSQMAEEDIWAIAVKLISGLYALHSMGIVHRDIKCANVFLCRDGSVKLGDLNVSKIAKFGLMQTQTGTPYYASPEVWQDKPYDEKCDIWSLGCVVYELASLHPPFLAQDMKGLYQKVTKGVYPPIPRHYSADLGQLISQLLTVDSKRRPSAQQVL